MEPDERSRLNEIKAVANYQANVEARKIQQSERYRIGNPVGMTGRFEVWYPDGGVGTNGVKTFEGVAPPDRFVSASVNPAENAIGLHHRKAPQLIVPRRSRAFKRKGVLTLIPEKYKDLTYWQYLNHQDVKFFHYYNTDGSYTPFGIQNKSEIINIWKALGMPDYLVSNTKKIDEPIPVDGWDVDYLGENDVIVQDARFRLPLTASNYAVIHLPLSFFSDITHDSLPVLAVTQDFVDQGGSGAIWEMPLYPNFEPAAINALGSIQDGRDWINVYHKSELGVKSASNTTYPVAIEPTLSDGSRIYADFYSWGKPDFTNTIPYSYSNNTSAIWTNDYQLLTQNIQSSFFGVSCTTTNQTKFRTNTRWAQLSFFQVGQYIDQFRYLGDARPSVHKSSAPFSPYIYQPSGFTFDSQRDSAPLLTICSMDGVEQSGDTVTTYSATQPPNFPQYEYFSVMHRIITAFELPVIRTTGDWLRHCDVQGDYANYFLAQSFVDEYQW
jgi:hypothetical protein